LIGTTDNKNERDRFRELLRDGHLEARNIDVDVPPSNEKVNLDMSNPANIMNDVFKVMKTTHAGGRKFEKRTMTIAEARPVLEENESEKLLENFDVIKEAIASVEENGIVFIDEIDKLVNSSDYRGADASSEGVQRDLLPLIEGSTISTKHGNVNTDFILFIASGAFHSSNPSGRVYSMC
jgi:ATP-dependent HslUV protease ATP-binding subunit HslU